MNIKRRRLIVTLVTVLGLGLMAYGVVVAIKRSRAWQPVHITGVVLRADDDPLKQVPLPGTEIQAISGTSSLTTKSDTSGFFSIDFDPTWERNRKVALIFRLRGYEVARSSGWTNGQICVTRLVPLERVVTVASKHPLIPINSRVRVRYSNKTTTTTNMGSTATPFEVVNRGGVPCNGAPVCSPDGKWLAKSNSQTFDAGTENEYRDARLSCIAGPCPFSRVTSQNLDQPGRVIKLSVLNWSDTVSYFLEAEVTRTHVADIVRYLYPLIFGRSMNFTLPAGAEGPSIEADVGGSEIVFPLGPELHLSWAACTATQAADHTTQFRCQLKDDYEFR